MIYDEFWSAFLKTELILDDEIQYRPYARL